MEIRDAAADLEKRDGAGFHQEKGTGCHRWIFTGIESNAVLTGKVITFVKNSHLHKKVTTAAMDFLKIREKTELSKR